MGRKAWGHVPPSHPISNFAIFRDQSTGGHQLRALRRAAGISIIAGLDVGAGDRGDHMQRRSFMLGSAAALASAALPRAAQANVPKPYSWEASPPTGSREAYIKWMVENRGENPKILAARWDRYLFLRANTDFRTISDPSSARGGRAFLLTPRDEF